MYTSFSLLALAGFLVAPAPSASHEPTWWRDYRLAQEAGLKEQKPLAVFVGNGYGGYHKLAQEGQLTDSVKQVLADSYVCVFLDTASPNQEGLIKALAVTKGNGLIISDRTGNVQAFHHDGQMAQTELAKNLQHFAEPGVEVRTTVTNVRVSYYPESTGTYRQNYVPATMTRSC